MRDFILAELKEALRRQGVEEMPSAFDVQADARSDEVLGNYFAIANWDDPELGRRTATSPFKVYRIKVEFEELKRPEGGAILPLTEWVPKEKT